MDRMVKGITPVISVILMLLISITVVGMTFMSLQRTTNAAGVGAEHSTVSTGQQASYNFIIENVDHLSGIVSLRNHGMSRLDGLGLYIDGQAITGTYSPIAPNEIGDILLDEPIPEGMHTIRVTTGSVENTAVVDIPDMWFADFDVTGA